MEKKIKKEIRKEIREYILNDVNLMLSRLGVSEKVVETGEWEDKYDRELDYQFCSAPIRQFPMIFKSLIVEGYMSAVSSDGKYDHIVVHISYKWKHFDGGSNGCTISSARYDVNKELPEEFEDLGFMDSRDGYVTKVKGITL